MTGYPIQRVSHGATLSLTPAILSLHAEAVQSHVEEDGKEYVEQVLEAASHAVNITNAIQHNDKEVPEVTVSATTDDETVLIRVADNGPGISDARKSETFKQGKIGLNSEGTGLGLYLVETLVNRYGGDVQVEDNDPEGTVFVVRLRIA